jgi:hypothetical protein
MGSAESLLRYGINTLYLNFQSKSQSMSCFLGEFQERILLGVAY